MVRVTCSLETVFCVLVLVLLCCLRQHSETNKDKSVSTANRWRVTKKFGQHGRPCKYFNFILFDQNAQFGCYCHTMRPFQFRNITFCILQSTNYSDLNLFTHCNVCFGCLLRFCVFWLELGWVIGFWLGLGYVSVTSVIITYTADEYAGSV